MLEKIVEYILNEHRGKTIGVFLGLVASILFISYGFWRTIFIVFCIMTGYLVGKKLDENANIDEWVKNLFKPRQ